MTILFETRALDDQVEFRAEEGRLVASGIAMRYGARSKPIDGKFREEFRAGAFAKTIQEQDVRAHNEHDGPYLARSGAGTLRLTDDRSALRYELDLPDTTAGRDAAVLLERGDIRGSSIGFRALPNGEKWSVDDDGMALRTVTESKLFRVDLTTSPYYDDSTAEVALRSFADQHGVELRSVLDAIEGGTLAELVTREDDEQRAELETPADAEDDSRETPTVVRARIGWLHS